MSTVIQNRYNKLKELHQFHQTHQRLTKMFKVVALVVIVVAWILTIFLDFTLPFFALHSLGTSLWLYDYISNNHNLKTRWDYLSDPMFLFLVIITIICVIYVLISASRCSPY